jgi:copper chaperone
MTKMTMEIRGMSCGHCLNAVSKALNGVTGVKVEQVRMGSASLEYDPAQVTPETIREAVADAGYEAAVIPSEREGSARTPADSSLRAE